MADGSDEEGRRPGRSRIAPFAGIAFLWFIGVVRSRIGEAEDRFFATVFLGSGLLFIALFLTSIAVTGGFVESAVGDSQRLADSGIWVVGRHVSESTMEAALIMAGVFTTATSTILLRTGTGPRWLALVGSVVAVIMVLDGQRVEPWIVLAFPAWVFALSRSILIASFRRKQAGLDANAWPSRPMTDADQPSRP